MFSNQILKQYINDFWGSFGGIKNQGINFSKEEKLKKLIELSNVIIQYKNNLDLGVRRSKFNNVKFDRHSLKSHKNCFICLNNADVRHHIIQLQNGGINSKKNLVSLCNSCHKKIHNWL